MGAPDFPPWTASLVGKWAARLTLDGAGLDGGAPLELLTVWSSNELASGEVDASWELCAFPLPGLGAVPDEILDPAMTKTSDGTLDGTGEGAKFTQPPVTFLVGAQLASPPNDPLPAVTAAPCAAPTDVGCVVLDGKSGKPGVPIVTSGLTPDADVVYVDLRARIGFVGIVHEVGTLPGAITTASVESHVVGCHLRGAADCAPADVAAIEAAHPTVMAQSGAVQWHSLGTYVTCPVFEMDPGYVLGDTEPTDGGI